MNEIDGEHYPSPQDTTTPVVASPASKDSLGRSHGDTLKMMNPTPNGYNSITNHKVKSDTQEAVKKHESSKHSSGHHKHSDSSKHSDHVKKKIDPSKHKTHSSSSKPKDSNDVSKSKEHKDKHKDGSKPKDSLENLMKKDKVKSDDKPHSSEGKIRSDNFKENEKIKDFKEKEKLKEKQKEKHKDGKGTTSSSSKDEKPKEKSSEKPKEKSSDKMKEKSSDKPKEKSSEKIKDKSEKPKEKSGEKHKEKSSEKVKIKSGESVAIGEKHKDKSKEKSDKHKSHESSSKSSSPQKSKEASPVKVKHEVVSEDEMPLSSRISFKQTKPVKREIDDDDDEPLSSRIQKVKKLKTEKPTKKKKVDSDEDDDDYYKKPAKKIKKEIPKQEVASPKKRAKKEEEEQEVWKWWEEEKMDDGRKWNTLEHNGPVFAPSYERVPKNVKFYYDGKHMELSDITEEVAGFYGRMLDHEYVTKSVFNNNFFKDWRKVMTPKEKEIITDLKKCNFKDFDVYYKQKSEERKNMSKEEKAEIKKQNEELTAKYGFCIIDSHKQKIGNFKIEPPGLFRGRGEHPKMGMLKRRVEAEDISINIGKEGKVPDPPPGHKWKEVRHDNTVSWLASWAENILGSTKYIMLNPSSKLKGEKDWQKYETARKLKEHADRIRDEYTRDFKSKEMKVRQRAVALYFIDKLALRAGNEKDEDTADTVGCCSLRVEHITLDEEKDGQEYVVSFDFLGKDSIRYMNSVPVEKRAFKNLKLFMENKQPGDDLFDRLNTAILNKYLNDLMEGLTAKVFRTYNASKTLQEQLDLLTQEEMSIPEKMLAYNRANRAVAILCNHQRAVPKGFSKSMENLKTKMDDKHKQIKDFKKEVKQAKQLAKDAGTAKDKMAYEKKKKRLQQLEEQLKKLEVQATDKEENKQIALGTSKLNYLDPRISVAWCKKWGVPIEKIYNRTQRDKFRWAIEMAGPDYVF